MAKSPARHSSHPPVELKPAQLTASCDESKFTFESTAEVPALDTIVGQDRAIAALQLGVTIASPGYNVFVSGLAGTGRSATIQHILESMRPKYPLLRDFCFVHKFSDPDKPRLLILPQGKGIQFKNAMKNAVDFLRQRISQMIESEQFQSTRKKMLKDFQDVEKKMLEEFDAHIKPKNFVLGQVQLGNMIEPEVMPLIEGKPVPIEAIDEMVGEGKMQVEEAKKLAESYAELKAEFLDIIQRNVRLAQTFRKELEEFERKTASVIITSVIDSVRSAFPLSEIGIHLDEVAEYMANHLSMFHTADSAPVVPAAMQPGDSSSFRIFSVNLILDNSRTDNAPVIVETQPNFTNIFGTIERVFDATGGAWRTDFSQIKSGSLLSAEGGFLVINALDALLEPGVWKTMKRTLLSGKLEILTQDVAFQLTPTALKPDPIPLNVKVIMIGDENLYQHLYANEEDFKKVFKINVDFDYEMPRTDAAVQDYARFIRKISEEEQLLHFSPGGVAAIVDYGVRHAGRQTKLSTQFSDVADVIRESHFYAATSGATIVTREHVARALNEAIARNGMANDKMQEMIVENSLLIDTAGACVGQVNGLAVYQLGNVSFGKPARITASTGVGRAGIINIEREAGMSGHTHDKGVLILSGYFRQKFAHDKPLAFTASICFEQSYGGVDGDSASSTEIYALLSSLSNVPIKQQYAVTGSVNQKGEIQPIGGVNEKVEGYFDVCVARGLSGTQGVLIPWQNVADLMLKKEIVDAVRESRFHIFPVRTIDEGIEILTGTKAGTLREKVFAKGSINALVDKRLKDLSKLLEGKKFAHNGRVSKKKVVSAAKKKK